MSGVSPNTFRHSIRALDLEARKDSKRATCGEPCDSVTLHIHGGKTDWLNQGAVRTHGALPTDRPNRKICSVRNLVNLRRSFPQRFLENVNQPFARLENDALATDRQLTLVTKRAAGRNGLNPSCIRPTP